PLLSSPRLRVSDSAWLRYEALEGSVRDSLYANLPHVVFAPDDSLIVRTARQELMNGLGSMLGAPLRLTTEPRDQGAIVLGKISVIAGASELKASELKTSELKASELKTSELKEDGYVLRMTRAKAGPRLIITGSSDRGVLYGVFALLRRVAMR